MKKRRFLIISLLLVAALTLGIGYAEMTKLLTINGDGILYQNDTAFVVEFTQGTITDDTGTVKFSGTSSDFNITGISNVGDEAVVTLTVTNNSTAAQDLIAVLNGVSGSGITSDYTLKYENGTVVDESDGKFLNITYVIKKNGTTVWDNNGKVGEGLSLAYGESATVEITVEVARTIKSKVNLSDADFSLDFVAES